MGQEGRLSGQGKLKTEIPAYEKICLDRGAHWGWPSGSEEIPSTADKEIEAKCVICAEVRGCRAVDNRRSFRGV